MAVQDSKRIGRPKGSGITPFEVLFWRRVEKTPTCWLYRASGTPSGYRVCWYRGKQEYAHRASWMLHFGNIPVGQFVCHRCDVKDCVRPDHLFLGSPKVNTHDAIHKNLTNLFGHQRLGPVDAKAIYDAYHGGIRVTQLALARRFGVARATICMIVTGRSWGHVTGAQPPVPVRNRSKAAITLASTGGA
jgi:hypothetical protein